MAPAPTSAVSASRRFSVIVRHHGAYSDEALAAKRDVRFEQAKEHISRAISALPPLTAEQISQLRALLSTDA